MAISKVNRTAIKSGLSLFLAGGAYVVIARRYSQISNCSTKAQLEAFAIVGIVQGSLATHFLTYKTSPSLKFFEFMVFTGIAVKKCGFEKPVDGACFAANSEICSCPSNVCSVHPNGR